MNTMSVIDAWGNLALPGTLDRSPAIERLFRQSGNLKVLEEGLTAIETLDEMDRAGIERMLVTAWHRPRSCEESDRLVRELVREYPERFVGIAAVDVERPAQSVARLKRAVEVDGLLVIRGRLAGGIPDHRTLRDLRIAHLVSSGR